MTAMVLVLVAVTILLLAVTLAVFLLVILDSWLGRRTKRLTTHPRKLTEAATRRILGISVRRESKGVNRNA
jgi:uncharacterized iron-regulated membrane protein